MEANNREHRVTELGKGLSINYVVSRGEGPGGGGQKLPILLSKKTTKRGHCVLKWVLVISVVL